MRSLSAVFSLSRFLLVGLVLPLVAVASAGARLSSTVPSPELRAIAESDTQILLEWNKVAPAENIQYTLQRSTREGWVHLSYPAGTETNFLVEGLEPETSYSYRISITSDAGGPVWSYATATTLPRTLPPEAPVVTAEAVSEWVVQLNWTDGRYETEFRVERKNASGEWVEIGVIGADRTRLRDEGLAPLTLYTYRVRAVNQYGFSPYSNEAAVTTLAPGSTAPSKPELRAGFVGEDYVMLVWNFNGAAESYLLEVNTGTNGTWIQLPGLEPWETRFVHDGLSPSTMYRYRMRARNESGYSEYAELEVITKPPMAASLVLEAVPVSHKEIELRWNDMATDIFSKYMIELADGTNWNSVATQGPTATNYLKGGLLPAAEYRFRIQVNNENGWSDWSYASATTLPLPEIPPLAPTLYADPVSHSSIRVKWLDVERETRYLIDRKNSAGEWEQIGAVPMNTTEYMDLGLEALTTYAYRMRAANDHGASPYSNEAAAKTHETPHPPEVPILGGGSSSESVVQLYWEPALGAVRYVLEKKSGSGEWAILFETEAPPFRYNDTGLQPVTAHVYRLRAQNGAGEWNTSAEISATTYPPALTNAPVFTARALSASEIELSWELVPFAESYEVAKLVNGEWEVTQLAGNVTNYSHVGLMAGTTYAYRLFALNTVSTSPHMEITARTHGSISGDIVITSIAKSSGGMRLGFGGSSGQRFRIDGSADFKVWNEVSETLTLSSDMQVEVPTAEGATFYRTRRVE